MGGLVFQAFHLVLTGFELELQIIQLAQNGVQTLVFCGQMLLCSLNDPLRDAELFADKESVGLARNADAELIGCLLYTSQLQLAGLGGITVEPCLAAVVNKLRLDIGDDADDTLAAPGQQGDHPVSYKHLDVYKRQNQETLCSKELAPSTYPCFSTPGECAEALYRAGFRRCV